MASPSYGAVEIFRDEILGIGSYGKVCKARCGKLPCAAKLLHDTLFQDYDPGTRSLVTKFRQECQFLSTIQHPNIVQYLGTATDPQSRRPVLLMELMDESLTRFLERLTGPLPYHSQLNICHDVALALAYLHSNAITHRDLSSNNVLLIGEGSRAKVTDFGMSKLMDMNPRMTPLTQVPGTPAYMPPEALTTPPCYSCKLDCFSHGVLTLQIITKNFPNPGDATTILEDRRFPTGQAFVPIPEVERRKKDIDLIEPSHPLLPTALVCLKDRDAARPSADELCGRLASLKREPRYTHSVEQTRGHIQGLQEEMVLKDGELERARAELGRANEAAEQLQRECCLKNRELERARAELGRVNEVKEQLQTEYLEEINLKGGELKRARAELQRANEAKEQLQRELEGLKVMQFVDQREVYKQPSGPLVNLAANEACKPAQDEAKLPRRAAREPLGLAWTAGKPAPEEMMASLGSAVAHGSTAYFSSGIHLYSYAVREDKWTKLLDCKYCFSALAVVRDKLITIGGQDRHEKTATNALLSFQTHHGLIALFKSPSWEEVLPPMPTKRTVPAAASTATHLVVAGGRKTPHAESGLATVEVLNTKTLQWSTASSSPVPLLNVQLVSCGGDFYLSDIGDRVDNKFQVSGSVDSKVFTCSVEDLLDSTDSRDGSSLWAKLTKPSKFMHRFSVATLRGRMLVVGGILGGLLVNTVHSYDAVTKSWTVAGKMPTPRYGVLTLELQDNELLIVGGTFGGEVIVIEEKRFLVKTVKTCFSTEIARVTA